MTSLHTSEINTHQITLHSQKIKPSRVDKFHAKDKIWQSRKKLKTKKAVLNFPRKTKKDF